VDTGTGLLNRLARGVRPAAFWVAVVLPLLYLLLLLFGVESAADLAPVGGLVLVNLLALRAGHADRHP
jgi:hypothetical protein